MADRGSIAGRIRWAAIFALLLLAVSAAPVLADPGSASDPPIGESQQSPPETQPSPGATFPDTQDIEQAYENAKRKERAREEELSLPTFVAEREASRHAYADVNPTVLSRFTTSGPVAGGDELQSAVKTCEGHPCIEECTASFGTRDQVGVLHGEPINAWFTTTAGHCFSEDEPVFRRSRRRGVAAIANMGAVRRYAWGSATDGTYTDGEAVKVSPTWVSNGVYVGNPKLLLPMLGIERMRLGRSYCWSGVNGGNECGTAYRRIRYKRKGEGRFTIEMLLSGYSATGDSGGPVWDPATQKAVALISAHKGNVESSL